MAGKKSNTPQSRAQENGQVVLELKSLKEQVKKLTELVKSKDERIKQLEDQAKSAQMVLDQAVKAVVEA